MGLYGVTECLMGPYGSLRPCGVTEALRVSMGSVGALWGPVGSLRPSGVTEFPMGLYGVTEFPMGLHRVAEPLWDH